MRLIFQYCRKIPSAVWKKKQWQNFNDHYIIVDPVMNDMDNDRQYLNLIFFFQEYFPLIVNQCRGN